MEFRDYFLIFVCFAAAAIFFFKFAKEKKVFIGAGFLCLLYGGYNTAEALTGGEAAFLNIYAWALRGFAVLVLVWMFLVLRDEKASSETKDESKKEPDDFLEDGIAYSPENEQDDVSNDSKEE